MSVGYSVVGREAVTKHTCFIQFYATIVMVYATPTHLLTLVPAKIAVLVTYYFMANRLASNPRRARV